MTSAGRTHPSPSGRRSEEGRVAASSSRGTCCCGQGGSPGNRHEEWGRGTVPHAEPDRLVVLFDDVGHKTLSIAAVRDNGALVPL
ncbi:hypothetical protein [Lentzea flaviverrucosa]|uniref:Uncharacterized protein n=1 Tax=Lentzea flaviverrucosa TaxID=200379 RepID=A0A1H9XW12_9PSEU|nr:hypothetical protein [Lentzea flaviverrucosa]RDI18423.1 uncharacterized protein DUF3553 [Lentzea flaviverrucosa]SES50360.1 Protein of unknown function [Lentzea flaviverrucosa]